jgi:hypothetical protein
MLQVFDVAEVEEAAERSGDGNGAQAAESRSYPLDKLTDDDLFHAGVPRPLVPAVRAIRTDAAFEKVAPYLPEEAQQVLFWVAAGRSLDEALRETLGTLNAGAARPESPGDFSKLDQVGNFNLVLIEGEEELRAILAEDIEMWRVFLHPYQRKIVEWNAAGPIKITGAAGTGKTVALMHRAVYLAKRLTDPRKNTRASSMQWASILRRSISPSSGPDAQNCPGSSVGSCGRIFWISTADFRRRDS